MGIGKERLNKHPSRAKLRAIRVKNEIKMKKRNAEIAKAAAEAAEARLLEELEEDSNYSDLADTSTGDDSGGPRGMLESHSHEELMAIADEQGIDHTDMDKEALVSAILDASGYDDA